MKRAASPLKSRWAQPRLMVQGEAENVDQSIALPKRSAGCELKSVYCTGIPAECREISNAGVQEVLIRILKNKFEIEAVYG